ncbi:chain length determinant protein tyrosine kinase EpsG [Methyloradius palustris]|uniref:Chain length determinant protein tyrosine kinase EpsG n=1 Tax=Methyloradius palustris TaxID=2778876 RepID=A0A8D5JVL3_9PROT|nr:chain length determinant protein tyrosine kinase EpsG [Methyloradius palustris]BCM24239.1 hypothetical protein ZMTM_04980 [Methyloradius palustris]
MQNSPINPGSQPISHDAKLEPSIGKLLLDLGKLNPDQAEKVLRLQKLESIRFGDAAIKLGFITDADVQQALSVQFDYPYLQPNQGNFRKDLVSAYEPFSAQVEALRALRSQLILRWFNEGNKALALVAANSGEGCSYLASNLAIVFSQLGEQTLLVDANLRNPVQHKNFNLTETRGLSDILIGRAGVEIITKVDSFMDLSILGAGTVPPNPQELLSKLSFVELMNDLTHQYDVVIIDTAPASQTFDAQSVAGLCGGALVISRLNETSHKDIQNLKEQLNGVGAQIVGAVINDF